MAKGVKLFEVYRHSNGSYGYVVHVTGERAKGFVGVVEACAGAVEACQGWMEAGEVMSDERLLGVSGSPVSRNSRGERRNGGDAA